MTDKELYTVVRQLGMKITKTDGEYRVNFRYGKEATAYYTNDRDDALNTANAMVQRRES
jgi:hypothetical protein